MSVKQLSTLICDSCDQRLTSQSNSYGSHVPGEWAEINIDWTDGAGENKYDSWHLCPKCSGELLAAILAKRSLSA